jgi:hypothetical protein
MLKRSPRRVRLLAVPAALLLALAACGDDDDDDDTTGGDDTEATIETVVTTDDGDETDATTEDASDDTSDDDAESGETYDADEYVDALVDDIGGDEEGAECVAQSLVDAIGTDRLEASGVTPEDFVASGSLDEIGLGLEESDAPSLQADLEACPSLVDLFGEAADASDEEIACVGDNMSQAQIAELFAVQFTGGTPSQELIDAQAATQACMGDEG